MPLADHGPLCSVLVMNIEELNKWQIRVDQVDDWSDALDYKIDTHIQLIDIKDPVKRKKLGYIYIKAERVCNRLIKKLCEKVWQKP